jgi:metallo-beta-lactamase family protein
VIIAASGMCDAGRVRHHLKRLLSQPEATIMLVGFQPIGTLGRLLAEGRKEVRIQGDPVRVRARIRQLDVYSGHADGPGLTKWAQARRPVGGSVYLVHGEPDNLAALRQRLIDAGFGADRVVVAKLDQAYKLAAAGPGEAAPAPPARLEPAAVSRLDWHNARAELMGALNASLQGAASDAKRMEILQSMKAALPPA